MRIKKFKYGYFATFDNGVYKPCFLDEEDEENLIYSVVDNFAEKQRINTVKKLLVGVKNEYER